MPRAFLSLPAVVALAAAVGCEARPVPVSGIVTLDGKPLAKAIVTFMPAAESKDDPIGSSFGITDDTGRYVMNTVQKTRPGVGVGTQRVSISIRKKIPLAPPPAATKPGVESSVGASPDELEREVLPARYNLNTELKFDVPSGGTDQANFDLKSK